MWSDSYRDYVKALVESNRSEYPYYVAHTCTYIGSGSSYNNPSFKVYLSKEPITASGLYTYVLPDDTIVYSVIGSNANSNYHSNRVSTSTVRGSLNIDKYEFIYSNAEYQTAAIQPNLTVSNNVSAVDFQAVSLILIVLLLASATVKLFKRS